MSDSKFSLTYQGEVFAISPTDAHKLQLLLDSGGSAFWRFTPEGASEGVAIAVGPSIPLILRSTGNEFAGHGPAR